MPPGNFRRSEVNSETEVILKSKELHYPMNLNRKFNFTPKGVKVRFFGEKFPQREPDFHARGGVGMRVRTVTVGPELMMTSCSASR